MERLSEIRVLWLPPLPGQGTPRPGPGVTWEDTQSREDPGYTHTVGSTSIACVPNANWESAREREGLYLPKG